VGKNPIPRQRQPGTRDAEQGTRTVGRRREQTSRMGTMRRLDAAPLRSGGRRSKENPSPCSRGRRRSELLRLSESGGWRGGGGQQREKGSSCGRSAGGL